MCLQCAGSHGPLHVFIMWLSLFGTCGPASSPSEDLVHTSTQAQLHRHMRTPRAACCIMSVTTSSIKQPQSGSILLHFTAPLSVASGLSTVHMCRQAVEESGAAASAWGPMHQGPFLQDLGIAARLEALIAGAGRIADLIKPAPMRPDQSDGDCLLMLMRMLLDPDHGNAANVGVEAYAHADARAHACALHGSLSARGQSK